VRLQVVVRADGGRRGRWLPPGAEPPPVPAFQVVPRRPPAGARPRVPHDDLGGGDLLAASQLLVRRLAGGGPARQHRSVRPPAADRVRSSGSALALVAQLHAPQADPHAGRHRGLPQPCLQLGLLVRGQPERCSGPGHAASMPNHGHDAQRPHGHDQPFRHPLTGVAQPLMVDGALSVLHQVTGSLVLGAVAVLAGLLVGLTGPPTAPLVPAWTRPRAARGRGAGRTRGPPRADAGEGPHRGPGGHPPGAGAVARHPRPSHHHQPATPAFVVGRDGIEPAHSEVGYRLGSDRGSPNHGSTLLSKRVMAPIRSPVRVRTMRPTPWRMPEGARR
jgi:hypothetical protein